ncbi:MAG: hypothetical protein J6S40_07840, partial [Thermoguttaceae bacterium]|nr:hypothetical protein [Thermoguttaceae bacterium]
YFSFMQRYKRPKPGFDMNSLLVHSTPNNRYFRKNRKNRRILNNRQKKFFPSPFFEKIFRFFRFPPFPSAPLFSIEIDRKIGEQYNGAVVCGAAAGHERDENEDSPSYRAHISGENGKFLFLTAVSARRRTDEKFLAGRSAHV